VHLAQLDTLSRQLANFDTPRVQLQTFLFLVPL